MLHLTLLLLVALWAAGGLFAWAVIAGAERNARRMAGPRAANDENEAGRLPEALAVSRETCLIDRACPPWCPPWCEASHRGSKR